MTMANQTTEKTSFTPGPWIVSKERFNTDYEGAGYSIIANDEGNDYWFIATIEDAEGAEANANLIAASKDMYEALIRVIADDSYGDLHPTTKESVSKALLKANGGTNL
jgi:hypothetical protein